MIDCIKTVSNCARITQGVQATLKIHGDKVKAALTDDMPATDVADYLVRKGVPFRQTHHIAGAIVRKAEESKVALSALQLKDLKEISPLFEDDVV
jgi:argininosuccinate lyase